MPRPFEQAPLFDAPASLPNGLIYRPEFVTPEEEATLLDTLRQLPLEHGVTGGYVAKRRFMNFGWSFDAETGAPVPGDDLPPFLKPIAVRAAKWLDIPRASIVEALVNEYEPGTALGWHRDNEGCETIIGISLGSWGRIRFRPIPSRVRGRARSAQDVLALTLEPRSAYMMQGDVRWLMQHSIASTPGHRFSITLRTLPEGFPR